MKCTEKEQLTCNVEKMGCEGCAYNDKTADEIKVGEYVRTKDGQIYKIEDGTEFYEDSVNVGIGIIPEVDGIWVDKEHFTYIDKRQIVKHSKNIIDLIEEGDYVNGEKIGQMEKGFLWYGWSAEIDDYSTFFKEKDIETVVTKEQFSQMEYKIKE